MALRYLDPLIEPSTKVVEWIEVKLTRAIGLIPFGLQYLHEVPARDTRLLARSQPLPVTESETNPLYTGPGHVLGQA
jgi:hypothetical protein